MFFCTSINKKKGYFNGSFSCSAHYVLNQLFFFSVLFNFKNTTCSDYFAIGNTIEQLKSVAEIFVFTRYDRDFMHAVSNWEMKIFLLFSWNYKKIYIFIISVGFSEN